MGESETSVKKVIFPLYSYDKQIMKNNYFCNLLCIYRVLCHTCLKRQPVNSISSLWNAVVGNCDSCYCLCRQKIKKATMNDAMSVRVLLEARNTVNKWTYSCIWYITIIWNQWPWTHLSTPSLTDQPMRELDARSDVSGENCSFKWIIL